MAKATLTTLAALGLALSVILPGCAAATPEASQRASTSDAAQDPAAFLTGEWHLASIVRHSPDYKGWEDEVPGSIREQVIPPTHQQSAPDVRLQFGSDHRLTLWHYRAHYRLMHDGLRVIGPLENLRNHPYVAPDADAPPPALEDWARIQVTEVAVGNVLSGAFPVRTSLDKGQLAVQAETDRHVVGFDVLTFTR